MTGGVPGMTERAPLQGFAAGNDYPKMSLEMPAYQPIDSS